MNRWERPLDYLPATNKQKGKRKIKKGLKQRLEAGSVSKCKKEK